MWNGYGGSLLSKKGSRVRNTMSNISWKKTEEYYTKAYEKFPGEVQGLDWGSRSSQDLRFRVLLEGIKKRSSEDSILDVGCGYGDISQFINWTPMYRGIDIVPSMIQVAKERYPKKDFLVANLSDEQHTYDWILASGPYNVKEKNNEKFLEESIQMMWSKCKQGVAFNILVQGPHDVRNEDMYFYNAALVLAYCRTITPYVVCRMDYLPHDAAFYLYRKDTL
jgi:SAM-dependent methyltransferase